MLGINPEEVRLIIQKAHQFHAKEGVVIPDDSDSHSDDWAMQVLADHASDPSYQELKYEIDSLDPEQQASLVALMWVGRGDYAADEWDGALQDAKGSWNRRTADYLIRTPLVADYLQEGLSELGYYEED